MMKSVSVIIPTYNRAHCIKRSVESVLCQTYSVKEVIVVDDGSTDNTEEVLSEISDSRLIYCAQSENKGPAAARNLGVAKATGEFIAFHDSDDVWRLDKLEKQMKIFNENPDLGLVYGAYRVGTPEEEYIVPGTGDPKEVQGKIYDKLLVRNTIGAPTILMKKEVFQRIHGYDESMRCLEDWDFVLRVSRDYEIGFVPEVVMEVTYSIGGVSSNIFGYYQSRCYMLRKYLKDYINFGILNEVMEDILQKASTRGILQQVSEMMELYLKGEQKV